MQYEILHMHVTQSRIQSWKASDSWINQLLSEKHSDQYGDLYPLTAVEGTLNPDGIIPDLTRDSRMRSRFLISAMYIFGEHTHMIFAVRGGTQIADKRKGGCMICTIYDL